MKRIAILGSTGSIGTQALDVVRRHPDRFTVTALSCGRNVPLLEEQIQAFRPGIVCLEQEADAVALAAAHPDLEVLWGAEGLRQIAGQAPCDLVLNALVGMRGLAPTMAAIRAGRAIALANKETLVAGGALVMEAVRAAGVALLPVDSEHSAIFQALQGNQGQPIERLLLTASGGPFYGYSREQLAAVTVADALRHPNWNMGAKITVDSATMMNKGLEVIEAHWLFGVPAERIEVVVHRESIIHSLVEFADRSVLAQMGLPDMRVPISYALAYPDRLPCGASPLDLAALGSLHFSPPDTDTFRCLALAYQALELGGSYPVVLNAANEELVGRFLGGAIGFSRIPAGIEEALERHVPRYELGLSDILAIDQETRRELA